MPKANSQRRSMGATMMAFPAQIRASCLARRTAMQHSSRMRKRMKRTVELLASPSVRDKLADRPLGYLIQAFPVNRYLGSSRPAEYTILKAGRVADGNGDHQLLEPAPVWLTKSEARYRGHRPTSSLLLRECQAPQPPNNTRTGGMFLRK